MVDSLNPVGRVSQSGSAQRIANPFSFFLPSAIRKAASGSITLDGMLNKSYTAKVRYDARTGKVFVATKYFLKPAEAERPMAVGDMQALESTLRRYMSEKPGRQPVYEAMNRHLRAAIAAVGAAA